MTTTTKTTTTKEATMTSNRPSHVLCCDATTFWIEEYDPTQEGNPTSQVVEVYNDEAEAREGLAKARAQQTAAENEDVVYAAALAVERQELGLT